MRNRTLVGMALMTAVVIGAGSLLAETPAVGKKAKVSLVPSVAGIVPGKPFEMAIHFELESGWHIYWQNSGDAGLPPVVRWKLPDGFEAGELQFPAPKREVSPGDIVTNILKGEPSLLVEVTPPAAIDAASATLGGNVSYLVCAANCIREETDLSVDLPVRPAGSETESANEAHFARARRSLPKPSNKVVSVTPSVSPDSLTPGAKFEFALKIEIAKGHHIQSDRPTLPSLIAADVFTERIPGIRFGKPAYPPAITRKDKYLGDLTEFAGTITVRIPGEVELAHEPGPVRFGGVFAFQACTDGGNCLPPDSLSFTLPVTVVASAKRAAGGTTAPPTQSAESGGGPASASNKGTAQGAPSGSQAGASIVAAPQGVTENTGGIDSFLKRFGLVGLLIGCFLYGLFINATPCVLPLLSIKVLGFVQQAHESRKRTLALGLAFGAGVMVFFVVLGLLAAAGTNILQFPAAVIGLGTVVMAMGLSMLGVFTLQPPTAATVLEASINKEGPLSSFGKGALAPVLGFACTGPLLAGAFGWATQQPPTTAVLAFFFAGFGMASPYMLLGANPHWLSFLPRPGNWMIVFERIMGFLLLAMVISLLHPLVILIGVEGLEWTLVFLVFVGLACWVLGQVTFTMSATKRWTYRTAAVALVIVAGGVIYESIFPLSQAVAAAKAEREHLAICADEESADDLSWRPWSEQAVEEAVRSGKIAFVDFTASYCTICKVNKKIALNTPEFTDRMKALGVAAFRADFTSEDAKIADALIKFKGSILLPLYLIYSPGKPDAPAVLDPYLSKDYLLKKLDEAVAGRSVSASLLGQ